MQRVREKMGNRQTSKFHRPIAEQSRGSTQTRCPCITRTRATLKPWTIERIAQEPPDTSSTYTVWTKSFKCLDSALPPQHKSLLHDVIINSGNFCRAKQEAHIYTEFRLQLRGSGRKRDAWVRGLEIPGETSHFYNSECRRPTQSASIKRVLPLIVLVQNWWD